MSNVNIIDQYQEKINTYKQAMFDLRFQLACDPHNQKLKEEYDQTEDLYLMAVEDMEAIK